MCNNTALTITARVDETGEDLWMVSAIVLVNTDLGLSQDKVIKSLRNIEGVEEAHALYGVYDFIIKIKALTLDKLREIIKMHIRLTAGVTNSLTLMIMDH